MRLRDSRDRSQRASPRLTWTGAVAIGLLFMASGGSTDDQASASPCGSAEHRALDFWIGEWQVTWTRNGAPAEGRNSIRSVLNGCALEEHWRGGRGHEGKSLTFYDPALGRWHQTWIDNAAQPLFLDGQFKGPSLELVGTSGKGSGVVHHRITWTPLADGVRQHWEQSKDGRNWQTLFDGRYRRLK